MVNCKFGANAAGLQNWNPEILHRDIYKHTFSLAENWGSEKPDIVWRSDGYPSGLNTQIGHNTFIGLAPPIGYQPGNYILTWDGTGTFSVRGNATVVSSTTGRLEFTVGTNTDGINIEYFTSLASDPLRNFQMYHKDYDGLSNARIMTSGTYGSFNMLSGINMIRFNDYSQASYSQRVQHTNPTWRVSIAPSAFALVSSVFFVTDTVTGKVNLERYGANIVGLTSNASGAVRAVDFEYYPKDATSFFGYGEAYSIGGRLQGPPKNGIDTRHLWLSVEPSSLVTKFTAGEAVTISGIQVNLWEDMVWWGYNYSTNPPTPTGPGETFKFGQFIPLVESTVSSQSWGSPNGAPISEIMKIAAELSANAWVHQPYLSDDAYAAWFVNQVSANLGAGLSCLIEYGNEIWNIMGRFHGSFHIYNKSRTIFDFANANKDLMILEVIKRAYIAKLAAPDLFANGRLKFVLAWHRVFPYDITYMLDKVHHLGLIRDVAIAPYFANPDYLPILNRELQRLGNSNAVIDWMFNVHLPAEIDSSVEDTRVMKALLDDRYGPDVYTLHLYESGQHMVAYNTTATDPNSPNGMLDRINRDPRIGPLITDYYTRQKEIITPGIPVCFETMSAFSKAGRWGFKENYYQDNPKWIAYSELANSECSISPPTVITSTLPPAIVGLSYPATTLKAQGGTAPYTWNLAPASQALPFGMVLTSDGVVSGVPLFSGNVKFSVRAKDSAEVVSVAKEISIDIGVSQDRGALRFLDTTNDERSRTYAYLNSMPVSSMSYTCWFNVSSGAENNNNGNGNSADRVIISLVGSSTQAGVQEEMSLMYWSVTAVHGLGHLVLERYKNGTRSQTKITSTPIAQNTWYFLGVSYNKAAGINVYITPGSATTLEQSGTAATTWNNNDLSSMWISRKRDNGWGEFHHGRLAAIKVWNTNLTAAEILAEKAKYSFVKTANKWGLYPFTGSVGDSYLSDRSGNNKNLLGGSIRPTPDTGPNIPYGDLAFITRTFPQGAVGFLYFEGVQTTGGVPPLYFDVSTGTIPTGFGIVTAGPNAILGGKASASGTYNFTLRGIDSNGFAVQGASSTIFIGQNKAVQPT